MRPAQPRLLQRIAAALLAAALSGCADLQPYFRDAGTPPSPVPRYALGEWPYREYWTGIIFNGEKIGFSRVAVQLSRELPRHYEIRAEAAFVLHFLGLEKKVNLKSFDLVRNDLTLARFAYDYNIDGAELRQTGEERGGELVVTVVSGGRPTGQVFENADRIFPSSAIALHPVLHGLEVGRTRRYRVYSGETQRVAEVTQSVEAYEASTLFEGNAFKVATALDGYRVTTWINLEGKPVFELALHGVMISALEDEHSAKRYLALAALNKKETLIDFSLVRSAPLEDPRAISYLKVALSGIARTIPSDRVQSCTAGGKETVCEIRALRAEEFDRPEAAEARPAEKYLLPSITVQATDPSIRRLARQLAGQDAAPLERIRRIIGWIERNIEKAPVDVFSALDTLERRKAECQGHAYLYAALARAAGIPTRLVNGLVYSAELSGFLYHTWAESLVSDAWLPVDPTFAQVGVDATHVKLIEGEALADLLPLIDWVGKVKIRVFAVEHEKR